MSTRALHFRDAMEPPDFPRPHPRPPDDDDDAPPWSIPDDDTGPLE